MSTPTEPQAAAQQPQPHRERGHLLRVLGVGFGLAVIIGNTIGAGILRTPGEVAAQLPHAWLLLGMWVLGGLYALLGAFSISELAAMNPRSGGYYVFTRRALGEFPGFAIGWTDWLAQMGTTAAVSIVVGEYAGQLIPALAGREIGTALVVTVFMAAVQWRGIRWGSTVQNFTSALKALGFVGLVIALFLLAPQAPAQEASRLPEGFSFFVAFILAAQAVIYTYDGWYGVIYFGEELKDPARDAPRSTIGGVFLLMAIYVLVSLALVYTLGVSGIIGDKLALATAAAAIFGPAADDIVRVLVIVSMLSGINAYHLMASRIPYAMGRDRLLPAEMTRVNPGGTPTTALFFSTLGTVGLTLLPLIRFGNVRPFENALAVVTFFFVTNYLMAYISMFLLRRREPEAQRPYRAWGYPWTTAVALLGSLAFLGGALATDTENSLWAIVVLAASYPLYLASRRVLARSPGR